MRCGPEILPAACPKKLNKIISVVPGQETRSCSQVAATLCEKEGLLMSHGGRVKSIDHNMILPGLIAEETYELCSQNQPYCEGYHLENEGLDRNRTLFGGGGENLRWFMIACLCKSLWICLIKI